MGRRRCVSDRACASAPTSAAPSPTSCSSRTTGEVRLVKVLSTPPDYDRAVVEAVREILGDDDAVAEVVHGTTVATNAVLEKLGARTAIVTTQGFRDVLELRRMRMPHLYDYFWRKPRRRSSRAGCGSRSTSACRPRAR